LELGLKQLLDLLVASTAVPLQILGNELVFLAFRHLLQNAVVVNVIVDIPLELFAGLNLPLGFLVLPRGLSLCIGDFLAFDQILVLLQDKLVVDLLQSKLFVGSRLQVINHVLAPRWLFLAV
jgi:hypothetical protein